MAYVLTKCFKCGKVVTGQSRELGKRPFHFDCLTCSNCKSILAADDNGKVRDNRIYCKACFTKRFRPRCASCRQPIAEGDGLNTGGKTLHTLCFRCAGCQKPMGSGKQVMIRGEIYCRVQCQLERVTREKAAAEALANAAKNAAASTPTPAPAPAPVQTEAEPQPQPQPVETAPVQPEEAPAAAAGVQCEPVEGAPAEALEEPPAT